MCIMNDFFQKTLREHDVESRDVLSEPSFLRNACMWNYQFSFDQKKKTVYHRRLSIVLCATPGTKYTIFTRSARRTKASINQLYIIVSNRVYMSCSGLRLKRTRTTWFSCFLYLSADAHQRVVSFKRIQARTQKKKLNSLRPKLAYFTGWKIVFYAYRMYVFKAERISYYI